jgi:UDP-N-acetylglucosamine 2-epimerase (non-hydrolysing)
MTQVMNLLIPFGTRPEIVKLAPVVSELRRRGHDVTTVATGQHDRPDLTDAFFQELSLDPDHRWLRQGDQADRVGGLLSDAWRLLDAQPVDACLLLGDTFTVPLFSLAARGHQVPVIHLEAGLRSYNQRSLEETNRRMVAAASHLHLAPTELAASNLTGEGIEPRRIKVVGNPVLDVLLSRGLGPTPIESRSGVAFTSHRATNVDDRDRLSRVVQIVEGLADSLPPVSFPVHPRTEARLAEFGLRERLVRRGVNLLPPLGYSQMLELISKSAVVVTDSGGIQEEAAWFQVPTVIMRTSTPRPEGVAVGLAELVGLDVPRAIEAALRLASLAQLQRLAGIPCPYGDGHTGERVAQLLEEPGTAELLQLTEPQLE